MSCQPTFLPVTTSKKGVNSKLITKLALRYKKFITLQLYTHTPVTRDSDEDETDLLVESCVTFDKRKTFLQKAGETDQNTFNLMISS